MKTTFHKDKAQLLRDISCWDEWDNDDRNFFIALANKEYEKRTK